MAGNDDIVARLRAYAKDQGGWHNIDETCEEAATEIERLRTSPLLNALAERDATIERLMADEARLRKALSECAAHTGGHADGATVDFLMHVPENVKARVERLEKSLRTVQNAAKTIASSHGTELEHLRQNYAFDQKLRAEVESLREANSLLTEQTDAAEARATTAERERDEAREQLRMQWCSACGVISAHGGCDCTKVPETAGLRRAVDFAKEFGKMVQESLRERDEARAEVERKDAALRLIESWEPATQEITVANMMAAEARAALTAKGGGNGEG